MRWQTKSLMKNAKKIVRLASLADMQRRDAAQTLAQAIHQQSAHRRQIEELAGYRQGYAAPLVGGADSSLNSSNAQQIVAFVSNLDNLVKTMEGQQRELLAAVQVAEQAWIASKQKAKSFEELAHKRTSLEQQTRDSREERNLDDSWLARHLARN